MNRRIPHTRWFVYVPVRLCHDAHGRWVIVGSRYFGYRRYKPEQLKKAPLRIYVSRSQIEVCFHDKGCLIYTAPSQMFQFDWPRIHKAEAA